MPIHTPSAPSISAAAIPRPSAIPPAAMTGIGATASTTVGTRASVETSPVWPPASVPCAVMKSTPAVAAWRAASTRADLAQHDRAGIVRGVDVRGRVGERVRDDAHALAQGDRHELGRVRQVADEPDAERPIGQLACLADLGDEPFRAADRRAADEPESSGFRDRGGEPAGRVTAAHRRVEHGMLDPELVTQPRPQRVHSPFSHREIPVRRT